MTGLDVEAVLRAHEYVPSGLRGVSRCACGEQMHGMPHAHRAHVAAVLRVEIESALGDAWDEGQKAWRRTGHDWSPLNAAANPYRPTLAATEGDRQ